MTQAINMDVLREILAGAERMVAHYSKGEEKAAQNAALIAAGLPPMHSDSSLVWDRSQAAKMRREVECLKAVISHFGGEAQQSEAA